MQRGRIAESLLPCAHGGLGLLAVLALAACRGFAQQQARAESPQPAAATEAAGPQPQNANERCEANASPITDSVTQLVVVTAQGFYSWHAQLQRYERSPAGDFRRVGEALPVVLGRAGYAWGDGLHGSGAPAGRPGPLKREGDGRSPAGVFAVGTVHGYAPEAPSGLSLPYRRASPRQRCVDDPRAPQYNRIVEPGPRGETWRSAERMLRDDAVYELALDIEHNRAPVVPGHGSCIFAHAWAGPEIPVTGCTGMAPSALRRLLLWLKPGALWVALPVEEYQALRLCWKLPDIPAQG